jgi:hypothetical protein
MKLILTADVDPLGKRGDVVDVADGYARNFLLPRQKAIKANEGALQQAEAIREARIEAERRAKEQAENIATQLVGSRVVLAAQAGDEGQLYGSVGVGARSSSTPRSRRSVSMRSRSRLTKRSSSPSPSTSSPPDHSRSPGPCPDPGRHLKEDGRSSSGRFRVLIATFAI